MNEEEITDLDKFLEDIHEELGVKIPNWLVKKKKGGEENERREDNNT